MGDRSSTTRPRARTRERGLGARRFAWSAIISIALAMAAPPARSAAPAVPVNVRIGAKITRHLAAPQDQPMHMPTDVAVDRQGRIFVADGANDRIVCFDAAGRLAEAITEPGGQALKRPVGLGLDAKDRLWIADTGNRRILSITPDGKLDTVVAPLLPEGSPPCDPTDVAVSADEKRTYVVDNDNHRILVRDNETRRWTILGEQGRALGQFQWPFQAASGSDNYVYVSEAIGTRVQRISPANRWAGEIGRWGIELGQFYRPKGVAVDAQGRLYVSDSTMGVVQVFTARGGIEGVLCAEDGTPLRFGHPMGMAFDAAGKLYVVELAANRVAVVELIPPAEKKAP